MLLSAAVLLTLPFSSTALRAVPVQAPASAADAERALKRILHLRSGTSLRVIARARDTGWEIKQQGSWQTMPDAAIERVTLERDVLKQLRSQRKQLETAAALADWMLGEGLLREGLVEVSRALDRPTEEAEALAVLERHAGRFGVPQAARQGVDAVLEWALPRERAARELALFELAGHAGDELKARFTHELTDSSVRRRSLASLALGRLYAGEEVRALLQRAVLDTSEQVRISACRALANAQQPELILPVLRATKAAHERVRRQAIEALGYMGYQPAIEPLVNRLATLQSSGSGRRVPHANIFVGRQFAYIQDFDVEVAAFQAVADPQVNVLIEGQVTDAGVSGIEQLAFAGERRKIQDALGRLTGEQPGHTSNHWLKWWEKRSE